MCPRGHMALLSLHMRHLPECSPLLLSCCCSGRKTGSSLHVSYPPVFLSVRVYGITLFSDPSPASVGLWRLVFPAGTVPLLVNFKPSQTNNTDELEMYNRQHYLFL